MKKRLMLSLLSLMLVSFVAFGFSLTTVKADGAETTTGIAWTNKIENAFTANEDGSVLTAGSAQTTWSDCIAYAPALTEKITFPYYVETRVQGLKSSQETRLGIVAFSSDTLFIHNHVCLRNGEFADMSHFGWLNSKDSGWQSVVNYPDWGFTADYTDFTIGVKYWLAEEDDDYCMEMYIDGNLIPGSQYNMTERNGIKNVYTPWSFGVFINDGSGTQTATFSEFKVEGPERVTNWTNKIENAFVANEDGTVLTTGSAQTHWADAIAYTSDLQRGISLPYYVETRVQGLQSSGETRLGIVALKNDATFIRSHVCIRNGVFADASHFGWLNDYIEGDNKDTSWQSIVNYDTWGFTVDYTDFTIGAKYWLDESGNYWAETYVNGTVIPNSQYNLTEKHGVNDVTEPWSFGVFFHDNSVAQTATFSEFNVVQLEPEFEPAPPSDWQNKLENSFDANEDDSVLTTGSAQNQWADAIAYNPNLTVGVRFPYYVETRVQGLQSSSETRLGVVALKNEATFIRNHVCIRNGEFADASHFGWLNDYIEGDNKDTSWQSIVNYADWKFTADYTDFTIGAKYWIDENGNYWMETYVNGNKIPGSEYNLTEKHGVSDVTEPWNFGVFFFDNSVTQTATFSEFKVTQLTDSGEEFVDDMMFAGYKWDYSSLWTNNGETLTTSNTGWRNNYLITGANDQLSGSYVVSYTFQGTREEINYIEGTDDDFTRFGVIPWYIDNNTFIVVELVWKASESPYLTDICLQVNGKDPDGVAAGDPEWSDCWVVNWTEEGSVRELLPKDEITLTIARLTYETYDQYAIYVNGEYITSYQIFLSSTYGDAVCKTGMLTRGDTLTLKNFEIVEPGENDKPVISGHEDAITTGTVGESVRVPSNLEAVGFMGCLVECNVNVTGPNGEEVSVKANKFIPEVAGDYVVTITATDPWGASSEVEYKVTVTAAQEEPDNSDSSIVEEDKSCKSSVGAGSALVVLMAMAVCGIIRKRNK